MPRRSDTPGCGERMFPYLYDVYKTSPAPSCGRPAGHHPPHRSRASLDRRRARAKARRLELLGGQ